ncbi:TPA: helix-turn-helix transcriptional regulator [Streptococcus suis]|uniref:helix-turn-helix transcriptional regulator n=1 Tax=Streptococcus suis TaxID=1307 RepID=UPI000CF42645|nr:helix-turn-helix transcriptional regulator [Streptococcus suis]MCK3937194.1 helix-turn-helix transcriptional regulator [Streptococcus suis]MCQ8260984.1 helix-turn-helix transcriptional regulator [Streptococcus suis]HEM6182819.1 helix-turn-helix transcriptional regulator [Streptococcus suis]HEM6372739.1 helix-turn-helix transcriptional regulator [Streptococcus suis]
MQLLLYEARKQAGYTQKDIADKLGISETTYRQKELGQNDFKLSECYKIAKILNKEISDLFTNTTSQNER